MQRDLDKHEVLVYKETPITLLHLIWKEQSNKRREN